MKRFLPLLAFLALGVLLFVGVLISDREDRDALPSPFIGKPMPAFTLPQLDPSQPAISSQSLLGQPYLLNVWASWCPTCRVEHPTISKLAQSGAVRVIGFNYKDEPEEAKRWLAQHGDPYELILADRDGRVGIDLGVYAAPESFLIGADGTVLYKKTGMLTEDDIKHDILPRLERPQTP